MEIDRKIIFGIVTDETRSRDDDDRRGFYSFMGFSDKIEKYISEDIREKIRKYIEDGKEGRFVIGNIILFVLPESFAKLHTTQYPYIVMKGDEKDFKEVIHIDEWWYTPFKTILQEAPISYYTKNMKEWQPGGAYGGSEYGYLVKFKTSNESEWFYGLKTENRTFDED